MSNDKASLVFIIDAFGQEYGRVTFNIQRGNASHRVGPFVGSKEEKNLNELLPIEDRSLLEYLVRNGLISGRCIDRRFNAVPDIASAIALHKNLFVRTRRYGSIRRAQQKDRDKILHQITSNTTALPGHLLSGEIEITEESTLRLSWKYELINGSVPFLQIPNGSETLITENGGLIVRDMQTECEWLNELSECLSLPLAKIAEGDFIDADISRLFLLKKHHWSIAYKGKNAVIRKANFETSGISWFDGDGLHDKLQSIGYDKIIEAYLAGRRHLEANGKLILLPSSINDAITDEIALRIATAGDVEIPFAKIASVRKVFDFIDRKNLQEKLAIAGFKEELRDYQLDGVLWLLSLENAKLGGILSDEMGLGKTVQTLAYILYRRLKSTLIVAPASVVPNWKSEIIRFIPNVSVIVDDFVKPIKDDSIVIYIISYQRALRCVKELQLVPFDMIVLDEGQFVKNIKTKTASALRKTNSSFRLVLTGTPVENSVKDLWAHLTFTNDFLENPYHKLLRKFPDFGKNKAAADLSGKAFRTLILRRTKKDVEIDLPPMIERIIYCQIPSKQKEIYQDTLSAFRKMLKSGVAARVSSIALEALLRLRQCCSLPLLLPTSLNPRFVSESVKVETAMSIIDDDIRCGRKTIVFSQFRLVLDVIEKQLSLRGIGVVRLDGNTVDREHPVKCFQNEPNIRVFIIGFRAGGFGLNLTAAESVILFDPWWNQAAENQAFARAHRIGQNKTVFIFKLICSNTIEDKMLELVANKATLVDSISNSSLQITTDELIKMIQFVD